MSERIKRTVRRTISVDKVTRPMTDDESAAFDKVFENFDDTFAAVDALFKTIDKKGSQNG